MERQQMASLVEWKEKRTRKPLIIQGARQVGKTHILKQFGSRYFPVFHYFNFEDSPALSGVFQKDLDPVVLIKELELLSGTSIDILNDLIIFDEIQNAPKALTSLKYFCEDMPEAAICTAGSLLGVTMNIDSFPVGKVDFLDLKPLSFIEFINALGEEQLSNILTGHDISQPFPVIAHLKLIDYWKQYLVVGGLPEAVEYFRNNNEDMLEAFSKVREIQTALIRTYMADVAKHSGKINSIHIEQVLRSVPSQLAKSVDGSANRFVLKDAVAGIRGYDRLSSPIGWLERASLILRVPVVENVEIPMIAQVKENIFKLYFFDVGLLGALSQLTPQQIMQYDFNTYKGFFAENFVLQELMASGISYTYCWQGRTSEVEFLLQSATGEIIPVEVKSGSVTHSKSLAAYIEKYKPMKAVVISGRNEGEKLKRWYVPIYAAGKLPGFLKQI
jgi:predicted AAA+ superfamily ATPase